MKIKAHPGDLLIHVCFGALILAAGFFFEQRLVADAAFYLAKIINSESFHVEHQRYVLALSQLLPLVCVKLHIPMKGILIAHSIWHPLYFYILFLICRYGLKEPLAGWWLLLCQTVGLFHGYFVPMFELYYAAGLMVLLYSLRNSGSVFAIITAAICIFFIMTSHLMGIVFVLWLMAALFLQRKLPAHMVISFVGVLLFIVIVKLFFISEYEGGKITGALRSIHTNDYGFHYLKKAVLFLFRYSPDVMALALATLFYTAVTDRKKLAVFVVFFAIAFASIHTTHYGFERSRYQEQVYFPLAFITAGSFFLFVATSTVTVLRTAALSAVFLVFAVRFSFMLDETSVFVKRATFFKKCIEECRKIHGTKCALPEAEYPADVLDPNWSFPIETMFLSSYSSDGNSVTVSMLPQIEDKRVASQLDSTHYLFRREEVMRHTDLNERYLRLAPGTYREIHPVGF